MASLMKEGADVRVDAQSRNWSIWIALVAGTTVLGAAGDVLNCQRPRDAHPWRGSHSSVTSQRSNNVRHAEKLAVAARRSESVGATALLLFAEPDGVRSDISSATHYTDHKGDNIYCDEHAHCDYYLDSYECRNVTCSAATPMGRSSTA